jgi:hypothetical protein
VQATFDNDRDAPMFKEMLNTFALLVLARRDWLCAVTWRRSDAAAAAAAAVATSLSVVSAPAPPAGGSGCTIV